MCDVSKARLGHHSLVLQFVAPPLQCQPRPRSFVAEAKAVGARLWHRPGGSERQGNQAATPALVGLLALHFAEVLAENQACAISTFMVVGSALGRFASTINCIADPQLVVVQVRDITTDPAWERAYGLVIPVLTCADADGNNEVRLARLWGFRCHTLCALSMGCWGHSCGLVSVLPAPPLDLDGELPLGLAGALPACGQCELCMLLGFPICSRAASDKGARKYITAGGWSLTHTCESTAC